jgi:hypothetical protein
MLVDVGYLLGCGASINSPGPKPAATWADLGGRTRFVWQKIPGGVVPVVLIPGHEGSISFQQNALIWATSPMHLELVFAIVRSESVQSASV